MQLFTELQLNIAIFATVIAWIIANFEPGQELINRFRKCVVRKTFKPVYTKRKLLNEIRDNIIQHLFDALECQKCLAFWFVLCSTGNLFLAGSAAILMKVLDK